MKYDAFKQALDEKLNGTDYFDIHYSPDFQCDQTLGFPVSLCCCFDKGIAWLELNRSLIEDGEDVSEYEEACAEFGIRPCHDKDDFNKLLRSLGEDAIQSAEMFDDEGMGDMSL